LTFSVCENPLRIQRKISGLIAENRGFYRGFGGMENIFRLRKETEQIELPPGFRFHPTDEELITDYLSPKVLDTNFSAIAIGEVDLNKCEPWELPCEYTESYFLSAFLCFSLYFQFHMVSRLYTENLF
jgi:hypothetical protein